MNLREKFQELARKYIVAGNPETTQANREGALRAFDELGQVFTQTEMIDQITALYVMADLGQQL